MTELKPTDIVQVTVHDLETKYVSRQAYNALAAEVARLKDALEETTEWRDRFQQQADEDEAKVARLRAALAALAADDERLAKALEAQAQAGCFCLPEDYADLVQKYGADKVEHSPYCKLATAALEAHAPALAAAKATLEGTGEEAG